MYTTAELFNMAADPEASQTVFLNGVTMAIPDDADGCADLDAEKARLSRIWAAAHMSVREMVEASGISQTSFAKGAGIPRRTVQGWCLGERECPVYVRFLLAEHYNLL